MALENEGSNPSTHPINLAPIAQRTEHRSSEPRVVGSNPSRRVSASSPIADILLTSPVLAPQTPLRISFLGDGTDFEDFYANHSGAVLSTAINKYVFVIWIRDNVSDDYEKAILDPWKASAFTAITGKKIYSRIGENPTTSDKEAYAFLQNGCTDTNFMESNGISIVYTRGSCNNPDLTEVRENIYLLGE